MFPTITTPHPKLRKAQDVVLRRHPTGPADSFDEVVTRVTNLIANHNNNMQNTLYTHRAGQVLDAAADTSIHLTKAETRIFFTVMDLRVTSIKVMWRAPVPLSIQERFLTKSLVVVTQCLSHAMGVTPGDSDYQALEREINAWVPPAQGK